MKYLIFLLLISTSLYAKNSKFYMDPFLSATKGTFQFKDSYDGDFYAIGVGGRGGAKLGPLFFAVDVGIQMPYFSDDNASGTQELNSPIPAVKTWVSYGLAAGIKFRLFTLTYTHYFSSDLKAKAKYDNNVFAQEFDYTYHGTGSKISFLLHLTKKISLGAEIANYSFDKYTLGTATSVLTTGDKADRGALDVNGVALLLNYKLDMSIR